MDTDKIQDEGTDDAVGAAAGNDTDYDLEDGEIESDDDDDTERTNLQEHTLFPSSGMIKNLKTLSGQTSGSSTIHQQTNLLSLKQNENKQSNEIGGGSTIDLVGNSSLINLDATNTKKLNKFKRPEMVDDDFAGTIENAIAAALKKNGIEPPQFTKLDKQNPNKDQQKQQQLLMTMIKDDELSTRSSKSRKRKKRENNEKERKKKLKHCNDNKLGASTSSIVDDIDDYEMLCIRGGSPPPGGSSVSPTAMNHLRGNSSGQTDHPQQQSHHHSPMQPPSTSAYYDSEDSYSSYDGYDAMEYRKMSYDERRQNRRNKDRRQRKSRGVQQGGGGNNEKRRNRDDADDDGDDCPRSHDSRSQRKLELCKFYLMECCAKKEKCSYMHSDFPCKYYYLGMKCIYKGACKFSHGKPLTEQLRNILLKHIETAPKEILGNFRRISRESATVLINTTHAQLCADQGIENTMATQTSIVTTLTTTNVGTLSNNNNSSNNINNTINSNNNNNTLVMNEQQNSMIIPSLLDMIIKPPTVSPRKDDNTDINNTNNLLNNKANANKNDKPRKSRWCDSISSTITTQSTQQVGINSTILPNLLTMPPPSVLSGLQQISGNNNLTLLPSGSAICSGATVIPSATSTISTSTNFLSLQNLNGVITPEQIEKLAAIGVETLDQVNQLTVAQLNNLGLSISQINEIQLNSLNIQKLGLQSSSTSSSTSAIGKDLTSSTIATIPITGNVPSLNNNLHNSQINQQQSTVFSGIGSGCLTTSLQSKTIVNQDIDMRLLPGTEYSSASTSLIDVGIASPESTQNSEFNELNKNEKITNVTTIQNLSTSSSPTTTNSIVDYSQYLKDSNLHTDKTDLTDLLIDEKDDEVLNEDEPELLIDESWCPSEDEISKIDIPSTDQKDHTNDQNDIDSVVKQQQCLSFDNKEEISQQTTSPILPATYDPKSMYPTSTMTNIIDISSTITNLYGRKNLLNDNDYDDDKKGYENKNENNDDDNDENGENDNIDRFDNNKINVEYRGDPRLGFKQQQDIDRQSIKNQSTTINNDSSSSTSVISSGVNDLYPKYERASIYDGSPKLIEIEQQNRRKLPNKKADKDMRMSSFFDSTNCDIDLRLPFNTGLSNYTPATEIDGSISSHSPIQYKVYEVDIPKPDYSEIRRSVPVSDKTLDPRLRRIFCLKESLNANGRITGDSTITNSDNESTSLATVNADSTYLNNIAESKTPKIVQQSLLSPTISAPSSGPRVDPRRKKENQDLLNVINPISTTVSATGIASTANKSPQQNLDIRILLQKSNWYKNLNSKYKIMVNQQLALVSTELKKFHQDVSPNKIFDMKCIMSNPCLQQIFTNLGIYIDCFGQILQMENDFDADNSSTLIPGVGNMMGQAGGPPGNMVMGNGGGMNNTSGGGIMLDTCLGGLPNVIGGGGPGTNGPGLPNIPMDFMRAPPQMGMNQRFMGNMLPYGGAGNGGNSVVGPRSFGDARPGLLGIAPGIQFNPFEASGGNAETGFLLGTNSLMAGGGGGPGGNNYNEDQQQIGGYGGGDSGFLSGGFYGRGMIGVHDDNRLRSIDNGNVGNNNNGGGGNRGNRNFRQNGGNNLRNNTNDRWGAGNRRNFDSRGGRDKRGNNNNGCD